MARLRGAETVIVGIQPELRSHGPARPHPQGVSTALDLEEGLLFLDTRRSSASSAERAERTHRSWLMNLLIPITADVDFVTARQRGRDLAPRRGSRAGTRL